MFTTEGIIKYHYMSKDGQSYIYIFFLHEVEEQEMIISNKNYL